MIDLELNVGRTSIAFEEARQVLDHVRKLRSKHPNNNAWNVTYEGALQHMVACGAAFDAAWLAFTTAREG